MRLTLQQVILSSVQQVFTKGEMDKRRDPFLLYGKQAKHSLAIPFSCLELQHMHFDFRQRAAFSYVG